VRVVGPRLSHEHPDRAGSSVLHQAAFRGLRRHDRRPGSDDIRGVLIKKGQVLKVCANFPGGMGRSRRDA